MFTANWLAESAARYTALMQAATQARTMRQTLGQTKTSRQEGLFKQVDKALRLLFANPRHPGLKTHEYHTLPNPFKKGEKVFEAYAQNDTPGDYRIFWCYSPGPRQITIIAITAHP